MDIGGIEVSQALTENRMFQLTGVVLLVLRS